MNGKPRAPSRQMMFDFTKQILTLWYIPKKQNGKLMLCRSDCLCVFKHSRWSKIRAVGPSRSWGLVDWLERSADWGTAPAYPALQRDSPRLQEGNSWLPSLLSQITTVFSLVVFGRRGNTLYSKYLSPINLGFLIALSSPGCLILVLTLMGVQNMQNNQNA